MNIAGGLTFVVGALLTEGGLFDAGAAYPLGAAAGGFIGLSFELLTDSDPLLGTLSSINSASAGSGAADGIPDGGCWSFNIPRRMLVVMDDAMLCSRGLAPSMVSGQGAAPSLGAGFHYITVLRVTVPPEA